MAMGEMGEDSAVFPSPSGSRGVHRTDVPTRSMDAVLTPLQDQVLAFLALPEAVQVDSVKRQRMVEEAQGLHAVLTELQKSTASLSGKDDVMGLTAGLRHRIVMDYESAVEHADDLVTSLQTSGPGSGNSIAVKKVANAAHRILTSVASALYAYDRSVIVRIEALVAEITEVGTELSCILSATPVPMERLQDALKRLSTAMVKFAELVRGRIHDLKDGCQRSEMDSCRITTEHCFRSFLTSIKVRLQHGDLPISKMNCMAVTDNFLELVSNMARIVALPYDELTWTKATPLAQEFDALERLMTQAPEELSEDSKKEAFAGKLCAQLDAIILHAKQVAESPRTGDRAGDYLLKCCDDAVGNLATVLQLASEEDATTSSGGPVFVGSTNSLSKPAARKGSIRTSESARSLRGSSIVTVACVADSVEYLSESVAKLRKSTQMALLQHTSAALAQMHRDRSLVDYLLQNAAVRNNAKKTDYSSQLLRQVERFEEVVSSVCSISTDLCNVARARRALTELRVLCPQAVAAAHSLFNFPASKVALSNMSSFEHAWHVELDELTAALRCLAPSERDQRDVPSLDRTKSASMHALSGPRLSTATVHRTSSISSFASFRQRLHAKKPAKPSANSGQVKGRLYASQPDVHTASDVDL